MKLQISSDLHRTKKTCFFCRTGSKRRGRQTQSSIQPLTWCLADTLFASIRAVRIEGSVRGARMTCRQKNAGNQIRRDLLLLRDLAGLLRSLLHCALRLLCLLSHVALL